MSGIDSTGEQRDRSDSDSSLGIYDASPRASPRTKRASSESESSYKPDPSEGGDSHSDGSDSSTPAETNAGPSNVIPHEKKRISEGASRGATSPRTSEKPAQRKSADDSDSSDSDETSSGPSDSPPSKKRRISKHALHAAASSKSPKRSARKKSADNSDTSTSDKTSDVEDVSMASTPATTTATTPAESLYAPPWSGPKRAGPARRSTDENMAKTMSLLSIPAAKYASEPRDVRLAEQSNRLSEPLRTPQPETPDQQTHLPAVEQLRYTVRRLFSCKSNPRLAKKKTELFDTYDNLNNANANVARLWEVNHENDGFVRYAKGKEEDGRIWYAVLEESGELIKTEIKKWDVASLPPDMMATKVTQMRDQEEIPEVTTWGNDFDGSLSLLHVDKNGKWETNGSLAQRARKLTAA